MKKVKKAKSEQIENVSAKKITPRSLKTRHSTV
jgi:hypothetical protein